MTTYNAGSLPERTTEKLEGMVMTEGGQLKPKNDPLTFYVQALSYLLMCVVICHCSTPAKSIVPGIIGSKQFVRVVS